MQRARNATTTQVIVIDTTHTRATELENAWWEFGVPEVSERPAVRDAHARMAEGIAKRG
jgi:3D-(3,5/4)-trihydroxycyclohexane-1,2-dione acylhydrolase (decyclizing)